MDRKYKVADIAVVLLCISGAALSVNMFRLDLFRTLDYKDEKPIGTVIVKYNIVQRRVADRVLWDRPMVKSPVYNGDLIRTDDLSAATLYIEDNSIDLDENTIIRIQRSTEGDAIKIELNGGTLYVATGAGGGNFVLNMGGYQVETRPDTILNATAGSNGIILKVSEGSVVLSNEERRSEITSGTMIALNAAGTEIISPAVIIMHSRLNAHYLKSEPEPIKINFAWDRINLDVGEPLRLEIASDKNFVRIVRVMDNLNSSAEAALDTGMWYWRIIRKDEVLHTGHFTITEAAGPRLLSPVVDTVLRYRSELPRVRFQWAEIEGASSYILEAGITTDFNNPWLRKETASAFLVDSSLWQGIWYWRVMPVFPSVYEGSAAFSPASFFRIENELTEEVVQVVEVQRSGVPPSGPQVVQQQVAPSPQPVQQQVTPSPQLVQQQVMPSPQVVQQQITPSPQLVQQQVTPSPQVVQQHVVPSPQIEQQYVVPDLHVEQQQYIEPATVNPAANIPESIVPSPSISRSSLAARLAWLLTNAREGDVYVIEVTANESIGYQDLSYSGRKVSITIKGDIAGRIIELNTNGSMFRIHNGVTLALENITLRGRNNNNAPLINVMQGGALIMNERTNITGNINNDRRNEGGGGVIVSRGGTFTMNNGAISANNAIAGGGGVKVSEGGTFTMSGGTISGNTSDWGGGVQVGGHYGTFIMRGGTISGNTAKDGGGVNVTEAGTFTMRGGTISSNTSVNEYGGGGVHIWNGFFSKTGGIIYGYSTRDNNSNRASNGNAHAVMVGRDNYYRYRSATATDMAISFDYTKNQPIGGRGWLE
jgi:hypothetical protein